MSHQVKKNLGVIVHGHGVEFRVWAPFATQVGIIGDFNGWEEAPLNSENDGYWSTILSDAEVGQTYRYTIHTPDGKVLKKNDPRARQITSSDEGVSIIVDDEFEWNDEQFVAKPLSEQILYELHIGTFHRPDPATIGTFSTAIEKLSYLKDLGITAVELMPITSMATSNGWGYAPNYIFSVENLYGGRRGLMEFVKACHELDIAVVLDVVYNHFFPETDLWQFDGWQENNRGGIYFYNDERGDTPWGGRPDYGRPEVRQFILDNVTMWLNEYHIDGLRVDSTIYMRNTEGKNDDPTHDIPDAWNLLGDITTLAHKINPRSIIIAEDCATNPYLNKPVEEKGCGFDGQWELGFPHVLRDALAINPNPTLEGIVYELNHRYDKSIFEKIIFSDSHDTAANGSVRLNEAVTPGNAASIEARQQALLANAVALTAPGTPMLLQGQEFMQQGSFNDWQMLEWDKTNRFSGIVLAHKHLIDLRQNKHNNTAGLKGETTNVFHRNDNDRVLGYHRFKDGGVGDDTIIIVNFSKTSFPVYRLTLPLPGTWRARFNSSWRGYSKDFEEVIVNTVSTDDKGTCTLDLPECSVIIFSQD